MFSILLLSEESILTPFSVLFTILFIAIALFIIYYVFKNYKTFNKVTVVKILVVFLLMCYYEFFPLNWANAFVVYIPTLALIGFLMLKHFQEKRN